MSTPAAHAMTLADALAAMAAGTLTARGLADAQLARIAATDSAIEAWAHLDPDHVHAEADRRDAAAPSNRGVLHGIGIGVKDIVATAEMPTQMGSPVHAGHRPRHDAECVTRLKRAGGYVFGKTVTTELAYFHPGKTKNPWNARHTPGGSSSGSAAAVAAGQVAGTIGTQTNGSVIRPASYCGVVGFKPTKDAIPFGGIHVFSETLDQVGVFARSVADTARLAGALADAGRVAPVPPPLVDPPRIAFLGDFPWVQVDCDADDALEAAATRLRQHGAEIVGARFPPAWREAHLLHRNIMLREAAAQLSGLQDRERARLSPELNAALDEGRTVSPTAYARALAARGEAIDFFTQWLAGFDAVIAPTAPGPAPEGLGATGDPSCCTLWSLTGFPAIAIPVGISSGGLPIGMQLAAPAGCDDRLLAVAQWCATRLPFRGLL